MTRRSLTAAAIERIKPPAKGQDTHFDSGFPGLALRVSYGGAKAFEYFYRLNGKQARMTLGRFPAMSLAEARDAWRNAREHVHKGQPPRPKVADDTFESVLEDWFKRDQAENRSLKEVRRLITRNVTPAWTGRLFATITRRDALDLIDGIADQGTITKARLTHAHLHRLFKWSVGRGIIEANPLADTPKPGVAVRRDRVLTDEELSIVWKATGETPYPFGALFRLLILTGARRDEIASLRWSEIQGDVIRLSGDRTKNAEAHDIPLAPVALGIIEDLPRIEGSEFVFTSTGKTPVSGFSKAKALLDDAVKIAPFRIHDLRRTMATGMQRLGISLQVIEACLGHIGGSRAGIVGVYQKYGYEPEKRIALEAWGRHVIGTEGKVIPLVRPQV
jgi:integrase